MPARSRPAIPRPGPGPACRSKAIKWLLMRHGPLVIWPKLDPVMWIWGLKIAAQLHGRALRHQQEPDDPDRRIQPRLPARAARPRPASNMTSAAEARCSCFASRSSSTAPAAISRCSSNMACLTRCSILPAALPRSLGLPPRRPSSSAGFGLPQDETGDCHMFTQALATEAAKLGVQFKFNTGIERLVAEGDKITGVVTSAGLLQADAYVAALGSWSPRMLKPIGISVPVYPVKGYSITVPVIDRRRRAGVDRDGRKLQGRDHAARRPHPRRRHRGNFRLFRPARRGAARDARSFPDRHVSARRRS